MGRPGVAWQRHRDGTTRRGMVKARRDDGVFPARRRRVAGAAGRWRGDDAMVGF
jgi:hypothetical protein